MLRSTTINMWGRTHNREYLSQGLPASQSGYSLTGTRSRDSNPTARHRVRLTGTLRNFNTIEEFRNCDKAKLLDELGAQVRTMPYD